MVAKYRDLVPSNDWSGVAGNRAGNICRVYFDRAVEWEKQFPGHIRREIDEGNRPCFPHGPCKHLPNDDTIDESVPYLVRLTKPQVNLMADLAGWIVIQSEHKIEHRMFCHITRNRRGRTLVSYATIVQLIGITRTDRGLRIRAEVDENEYPTKEVVAPEQLARVRLRPAAFHGEWNYAILRH